MESSGRLTQAERIDWLRLIRSENVGPRTFRALLDRYGSANAALAALPALARRGGAAAPARIATKADAEREIERYEKQGVRFVARDEPEYPSLLRVTDDAPPLLAVAGALETLARPAIAIVGARNASAAGLKMAERLARDLGEAGFVIVSGLARGIDGAAHRASAPTGSVAVLAGGHDKIYPPEHDSLLASVLETGAAVSEMPPGWEPRARDFPRRNRIISGLAFGVVVVEAAQRSGSLISARRALDYGREVFAVPGSPLDPRAEGSNRLLKDGAALVTAAADIIDVIEPMMKRVVVHPVEEPSAPIDTSEMEPNATERTRVIGLLGPVPVGLDDLVRLSGAPPASVRMVLLELEIAGRLTRHGGSLVSLV